MSDDKPIEPPVPTPEEQCRVKENAGEKGNETKAGHEARMAALQQTKGTGTILDYMGGVMGDPDAPPAKPGRPAEHGLGVLYQGPWQTLADGFNEHVRRSARVLALTGCPVQLQGLSGGAAAITPGMPQALPADLREILNCTMSRYSVRIQQAVLSPSLIHNLTTHRFLSAEELRQHNYLRVVYTVFEADRLPASIIQGLARVGQVWVACEANARTLVHQGIEHVRVVPIPYFDDDPLLQMRGRQRKPGPPKFYHIGKWEPRKAQDKLILGFMRAFAPGDAYLVMKITKLLTPIEHYPQSPQAAVEQALRDASVQARGWSQAKADRYVEIVDTRLPAQAIQTLHRISDVYVSLSRGEGFDMPALDAKLAGNLLVYTASGGPQDFAAESDLRVQQQGWQVRHEFYTDWDPEAQYLDFDMDDVVKTLRAAAERVRADERPLMFKAPPHSLDRFRAERVGHAMLQHLEDLLRPIGAPVFERERQSAAASGASEISDLPSGSDAETRAAREHGANDAKGDGSHQRGGEG